MKKIKRSNIQLIIKSINKKSLVLYQTFLIKIFSKIKINYKLVSLPKKIKRITLLKSPHVNKAAREQFEIKTYKVVLYIENLNMETIKFLCINKPKIISLTIKKGE